MNHRLAGYLTDSGFDPAEDHIGPFYYRKAEAQWQFAFIAEPRHCNAFSTLHGGVLVTFADFSLCIEATDHYSGFSCATVSLNTEFVAAGKSGDLVEAHTETIRRTRSLAFVRGHIHVAGSILLTCSSVIRLFPQ